MPPLDRTPWHDTFFYVSNKPDKPVASLWAAKGISNINLHAMLEMICCFTDDYDLYDKEEELLERDGVQLQSGNYYIVTNGMLFSALAIGSNSQQVGSISITDETPLRRSNFTETGPRHVSFRHAVRERDMSCVVTGRLAPLAQYGWWLHFEASHIFPLAYQGQWNDYNYDTLITFPPANPSHGNINSVQNGLLLSTEIHDAFDSYSFSINPDA